MKKLIATGLIIALIFTACGKQAAQSTASTITLPEPKVPRGRYIEQDITPEFSKNESLNVLNDNTSINAGADGTLYSATHIAGKCVFLTYKNDEWFKQSTDNILGSLYNKYMGVKDGYLYETKDNVTTNEKIGMIVEIAGPRGELFTPAQHSKTIFNKSNGKYISGEENYFFKNLFVSVAQDVITSYDLVELSPEITEPQTQNEQIEESAPASLNYGASRVTREYTFIIPYDNKLLFYDLSDNKAEKLGELSFIAAELGDNSKHKNKAAIIGDIVCLALEDKLQLKSLSSGEALSEAELSGIDAVTEGADGAFYAIGKSGIWRITSGGLSERIVDGAMCAFSAPSKTIEGFCISDDGSFFVHTSISKKVLQGSMPMFNNSYYKYSFSPDTPVERTKTLHVWTLRDSPTITETAAEYMRLYPDTRVYVEALNTQGNPQIQANAIKQLIKTVKEGKGPDVIITDGINTEDLYSNGVLAPLPAEINLHNYESAFLPAGKKDGVQYIVFGRVLLPQLEYNSKNVKEHEIYSFADNLQSFKTENFLQSLQVTDLPETLTDASVIFMSQKEMFEFLYITSAAEIWQKGTLNEQAFKDFLAVCKELNTRYIAESIIKLPAEEQQEQAARYSFLLQGKYTPLVKGAFYEALKIGRFRTDSRALSGLYSKAGAVLTCGAAISSSALNRQDAANYINALLSERVQGIILSDGTNAIMLENDKGEKLSALDEAVIKSEENISLSTPLALYLPHYALDDALKEIVSAYLDNSLTLTDAVAKAKTLK